MRNTVRNIIGILLLSACGFSQNKKLDSLLTALSTSKNDTNKVNSYILISDQYKNLDLTKCEDYAQKAIELGAKMNFVRGVWRAVIRKASVLAATGKADAAITEFKNEAILSIVRRNQVYYADLLLRRAQLEFKSGHFDEAIKAFTAGDSLMPNDSALRAYKIEALYSKARCYQAQGQYVKAIASCNRAIDLAEKNKAPRNLADCYVVLGNIFFQQKNYDKALAAYSKILPLAEKAGNKVLIAGAYLSIGNCYIFNKSVKDHLQKARENYLKCLKIREELGDELTVAYVLSNLGDIEIELGNYDIAEEYHRRGMLLAQKLNDPTLMLGSLHNLSGAELKSGKYDLAEKHELQALDIARNRRDKDYEWKIKNTLAQIYFAKGKFKEAYLYKDSTLVLKDTMLSQQQVRSALEMEEKYQNEKKQNEIELQKLSLELKDTEIENAGRQKTIIIAVLALTILFLVVLFNRFQIINKQKTIISRQKTEVEEQKNQLQEKQKEIFDSLQYAKQIQKLLLANHKLVNEVLPDSFVVFKPKDIVSGDFYWAARKEDRFYLAVCDSTGHGVPGAFMSLLNINFLNEAVNEKNIAEPNNILNYVRNRLIENISQQGRQDGMDGVLICVNEKTKKITYAAANNAPVIIKNETLSVLDSDKMPIGKGERDEPFRLFPIEINKGDMLFLYTDGYADQFGGQKGKKYKYKPLNEFIIRNHKLDVLRQEELLYQEFDNWKGNLEQVDDVCILGIRL